MPAKQAAVAKAAKAKTDAKANQPGPFGVVLKRLRAKYGVSQAKLAAGAGCSAGYIGLIELGIRGDKPSRDVIKGMASTMGANLDELEEMLRAAGWIGAREALVREGLPDAKQVISDDPVLTKPEKDLVLHMLEVFNYDSRRGK